MLQLQNITKSYTTGSFTQVALDDVSVSFRDNEFVAILGPSGSGKTTLLNIIGGLDHYDSGDLIIDGISTKDYKDRDWDTFRNNRVGFVFQSYNLIPHQTVLANVELALTLSGVGKEERKRRAIEALEKVGLGEHVDKKPSQLSGGQMQRVAIARALINDPEILLADEPTGALDSKTSVQIMDLLTEIADERLVVMVTHNPELADEYATRIVNLADGVITNDTDPFVPTPEQMRESGKSIRQTSMSFLTALSLSFNNLMTKKGRTIMTAVAGSIGIIGIAAILSLANGVNNYIEHTEEETLSMYPVQIMSTGFDMTSLMAQNMGIDDDEEDGAGTDDGSAGSEGADDGSGEGVIGERRMVLSMFDSIKNNDLESLKAYLEEPSTNIHEYAKSVEYSYNVTPQVYDADTSKGIYQINPDTSFAALGIGSGSSASSIMSMSMSTDIFEELGDLSLFEEQYIVKAGHWPTEYNECMLVLGPSGRIPDVFLYDLGIRDRNELSELVKSFVNEEEIDAPDDELSISYEEIMSVSMKLVNEADYYQYDETYGVWVDKSGDEEYMRKLIDEADDIVISGVAFADPDSNVAALGNGIMYTPALIDHLIDEAAETQIVKDQLANPTVDVFNNELFSEEDESGSGDFDMSEMFSIDEGALAAAFSMDTSGLGIDMDSLDVTMDPGSLPQPPPFDASSVGGDPGASGEMEPDMDAVAEMANAITEAYWAWVPGAADPSDMDAFMQSQEAKDVINEYLPKVFDMKGMQEAQAATMAKMQQAMQSYMQAYMSQVITAIVSQMSNAMAQVMTQAMTQMGSGLADAMSIDGDAFMNAFQFNLDEDELTQLIVSMMTGETASFDNNLAKLGYADKDKPAEIDIYPYSFESKQEIIRILDDYNQDMRDAGEEAKEITYTDLVGTLMKSVTTIIDMISYVLIAFVSISLIVSSIMIGVITYISVLERKKEIGILRAIGASKFNISEVFNAETVIEGLISGVLGVGVTALACIPASAIVYSLFGVPDVALLPWQAAVILILISVFLTFIAGLLPARSASRRDPVEALRSE